MAATDMKEPKKGHGCFFYGCLTVIILFLAGAAVSAFAVWKLTTYALNTFADAAPMEASAQTLPSQSAEQARQKVTDFSAQLDQKNGEVTLALTQDELNALLAQRDSASKINVRAVVEFHPNSATANISIPLDEALPRWIAGGRYLNGAATLDISMRNGQMGIFIKSLKVKGKPLPEMLMQEMRRVNLAEEFQAEGEQNPLKSVKRIEIQEGQISIIAEKL